MRSEENEQEAGQEGQTRGCSHSHSQVLSTKLLGHINVSFSSAETSPPRTSLQDRNARGHCEHSSGITTNTRSSTMARSTVTDNQLILQRAADSCRDLDDLRYRLHAIQKRLAKIREHPPASSAAADGHIVRAGSSVFFTASWSYFPDP